jgi:hypothetical protein
MQSYHLKEEVDMCTKKLITKQRISISHDKKPVAHCASQF